MIDSRALAIKVENISKAYQLGEFSTGTISRDIERWFLKIRGKEDPFLKVGETNDRAIKGNSDIVWSLKDINFEIKQGDAVGIIGRNGAGKSTMLKILSRITTPTTGTVKIKGRIASLLEIGTGFHPELTGRENIFLNGAILGMRKAEIKKHFDAIVDFSGGERYIDTPVKRYSSGMYVRLAFGVAAHLQSEILIIDEVLAVGDAEFQKKCIGKMDEVSKGGRTVLFVSHQLGMVSQLCKTSILMDKGSIIYHGGTKNAIELYLSSQKERDFYFAKPEENIHKEAYIIHQKMLDESGSLVNTITCNQDIILEIKIFIRNWNDNIELSIALQHDIKGVIFCLLIPIKKFMQSHEKEKTVRLSVASNYIMPNSYSWQTAIHIPNLILYDILQNECPFSIQDVGTEFAKYDGLDNGVFFLKDYTLNAVS